MIRNVFSKLVLLFCLCGFFLQVTELSFEYFSYPITVDVQVERHEIHYIPSFSFCFQLDEILNKTAVEESTWYKDSEYQNTTLEQLHSNLTEWEEFVYNLRKFWKPQPLS